MSDDFLSRWSRRKIEVKEAEAKEAVPVPSEETAPEAGFDPQIARDGEDLAPPPGAAAGSEPLVSAPEITAEEIAKLPPVEDLTSSSDLAPFLRAGVPTLLRNAALRRMWTVDPGIRDFLNDAREYAYDWNVPGGAPGLGPLLPCDDVKAMVRRIFDSPAGSAEPLEEVASASEEPDREPSNLDEPSSPASITEDLSLPQAPAPLEGVRAPIPVEAEFASAEAAPATAPEGAAAAGSRRPRRHGGATPA
jgi:hypothetical protein